MSAGITDQERAHVREELGRELGRWIEQVTGTEYTLLLALHISSGAFALGIEHVEPLYAAEEGSR